MSQLEHYFQRIGDPSPANSSLNRRPINSSTNGHNDNIRQISSDMHSIRLSMKEKRLQMEQEKKLAEDMRKHHWQDIGREAFLRVLNLKDHDSEPDDGRERTSSNQISNNTSDSEDEQSSTSSSTSTSESLRQEDNIDCSAIGGAFIINDDPHSLSPISELRLAKKREMMLLSSDDQDDSRITSSSRQILNNSYSNSDDDREEEEEEDEKVIDKKQQKHNQESSSSNSESKELVKHSATGVSFVISAEPENANQFSGAKMPRRKMKKPMQSSPNNKVSTLKQTSSNKIHHSKTVNGDSTKSSSDDNPRQDCPKVTPAVAVGFVIGTDPQSLDPVSELEMAKKKEQIMMQSLRRKADTEEKLRAKKLQLERKRNLERQIKEAQEKKKEEERIKRQIILEQFRMRKAAEDSDKNPNISNISNMSSRESTRNSGTVLLSRPSRPRLSSGTKPRPKSLFVKSSDMPDCTSLDPGSSRLSSDGIDSNYSNYASTMALNHYTQKPPSRPGSSMSNANCTGMPKRLQSPTSRFPQLPTSSMLNRYRGPSSDGASDAGSTFSEYTGPKLYVKPTQKSNRGIILNAINVVLAGAVNSQLKKNVVEEITNSASKHFLILFRGAGMQFRGIYSYDPDREEVIKLHGKGPKIVTNDMMDKFYKYNCGGRNFNEVLTRHLSVTIDAFTIHNTLWSGKRMIPAKKDSF